MKDYMEYFGDGSVSCTDAVSRYMRHGLVRFTGLLVYLSVIALLFVAGCGRTQVLYDTDGHAIMSDGDADTADAAYSISATGKTDATDLSATEADATVGADTEQEEPVLVVHLCGAVNEPGVYELDIDSRIIDGINKAGGFSEDASRDSLNLAMELKDGSRIYVPTIEEAVAYEADSCENASDAGGKININTADADKLTTLKGVGLTRAQSIIAYRDEHGGFGSIEEIMNVSGIGKASFEKIKDEITVR